MFYRGATSQLPVYIIKRLQQQRGGRKKAAAGRKGGQPS
jgi:hypothetical protein